jgi:hypothetical protein
MLEEQGLLFSNFTSDFAFIPQLFKYRGWMSLIAPPAVHPFGQFVKEFYANIEVTSLHSFTTYVHSQEFTVDMDLICAVIEVP